MIGKAFRDLIVGDAGIIAQLATFKFDGVNDSPAVFAFDDPDEQVPEDVPSPHVMIQMAGGTNFGDRGSDGARLLVRVTVWGDRDRGTIQLLARDIWRLLNKGQLTQTGVDIYGMLADPPQLLEDPDGFPGYLINANPFVSYDD